jgi:hypothetical protein
MFRSEAGCEVARRLRTILVVTVVLAAAGVVGAFWWANTPPDRPHGVSGNAVFLWAGHVGLPAPKHGTWIECWVDAEIGVNKCKLTEMEGTPEYEGVFLANAGTTVIPQSDLKIEIEPTSNSDNWVRFDRLRGAPLIFLKNGSVLIPKDAYSQGLARLNYLREVEGK